MIPDALPAVRPTINADPPPLSPQSILAALIETESRVREALNQHTFKRDVTLQTIGPNGEVTGEYIRNSQFLFDDKGNRIERVFYHPGSTIRQLKITKEDIQRLSRCTTARYRYYRKRKIPAGLRRNGDDWPTRLFAFDVTPVPEPNPQHMRERFFVGRVWADAHSFQIVKVEGIVEPRGKQRFPVFQTVRESTGGDLCFLPAPMLTTSSVSHDSMCTTASRSGTTTTNASPANSRLLK